MPMLVSHGNLDYRVPPGAKFLYFPDGNYWILKPGNSKVWYQTVFAFLAQHVRDEPWRRPHLL